MNTFHAISKNIPIPGMKLVDFYRFINLHVGAFWNYEKRPIGIITNVQNISPKLYMVQTDSEGIFYVWEVVKKIPKKCLDE